MGLDCSGSCMKYLLFFFNFIFWCVGAAILAVGIWAKVDPAVTEYIGITIDDSTSYDIAIILLICVGAFIFLLGFLGCCGACKESSCMLGTFAVLLTILVLVQIVAAILVAVFQSDVNDSIQEVMLEQIKENYFVDDGITKAWDRMQSDLECCGVSNSSNWDNSAWQNNKTNLDLVPYSCCDGKSGGDDCLKTAAYSEGCYDKMLDWINEHAAIIMGVGFGLAFIEIMGIVMACCVRKKIDAGDYYS